MRVLLVEDEPRMASLVRRSLGRVGMACDVAGEPEEGLRLARVYEYDAIVLDVMLPGASGFEVCRRLRQDRNWAPVLMLTARDAVRDRVEGLDSGADDYLVKPFALAELHARLRSLIRRGRPERPAVLTTGTLRLDPARHEVWRGETSVDLSATEFTLLETLMRRAGEVVTRSELIEHAWDMSYEPRSNVVDVYVRRLRDKVDRPFGASSIETVRGAGYRVRDGS
jgi:two-component system OmpR family response regulator